VEDRQRVEATSIEDVNGMPDTKENADVTFDDSVAREDSMGIRDGKEMSDDVMGIWNDVEVPNTKMSGNLKVIFV
jgi:hypothetical protein